MKMRLLALSDPRYA